MSFLRSPHRKQQGSKAPGSRAAASAETIPTGALNILSAPESTEKRVHSIRRLTLFVGILTALVSIGFVVLSLNQFIWQLIVLAVLFGICAGFSLLASTVLYRRKAINAGLIGVSICFGAAMLGTAALLANLGIPAAIIYLIFALIISSAALGDTESNLAIGIGILFASGSALVSSFSPFPQLSISLISMLTPLILVILLVVYVILLGMQFVAASLRIRLVTAFLAIVIIPLTILSVVQSQFMYDVLNREVSQGLVLAAHQATSGVDKFLTDTQKSIQEASLLNIFTKYLSMTTEERANSPAEQEMRMTLRVMDTNEVSNTIYLSSYALLDKQGINVYDTLRDRVSGRLPWMSLQGMGVDLKQLLTGEGGNESAEDYFTVPMKTREPYISPVKVYNSTRGFFFISAPIKNSRGEIIGVLRARFDGLLLQDLLKQYNGLLTARSYAILVDENNIRLADAFTPNFIYKSIAPLPADTVKALKASRRLPDLPTNMLATNYTEFDQLLKQNVQNPVFTTQYSLVYNDNKHSEIGAISALRSMPWRVVYLRADYSGEEVRRSQQQLATLVTVVIAAVVAAVAVFAAQVLSRPIIQLTKTAQRIASGDLEAKAPVRSADEFGMLGAAFNYMTSQMHDLINQLEERVKARTREIENKNQSLANRARQLQTVAEVARQIVSAQELELLLSTITQLVSARFGFYHVGVFLLDESKQNAVLRASNSAGGQRMLARQHTLPVGKVGIVGYATGTGEPKIVTDVGEDAVYFNNPDLPETRSEMALPLKVGDQVIGALDIQSKVSNDFRQEDIELFNTLADQVAIAIYNNELYAETRRALDEAQTIHRQYLRGEWAADVAQRKTLGYLFNQTGVTPQQAENPLWNKVFNSGEPVYAVLPTQNGSPDKAVMAVPIAVRGETIGVIHVQDQGDDRIWTEDEITVVNSIANQVAVALENARLFENTVRRAEREKKVLQITAKIRATNDPGEMMQIAVSELQQALSASRTQIYIRHAEGETGSTPAADNPSKSNGNGHTNGRSHGSN